MAKKHNWKITEEQVDKYAKELILWMGKEGNFYLIGFAVEKGINKDEFDTWAKRNSKFALALKRAKDMQEYKLANFGLQHPQKAPFSMFSLKNCAGWRDRQDMILTGDIIVNLRRKKQSPTSDNNN